MSGIHIFVVYDPIDKGQVFVLRRSKGNVAYRCVDVKKTRGNDHYKVFCKDVWPQWWYFWLVGFKKWKRYWTREWKPLDFQFKDKDAKT